MENNNTDRQDKASMMRMSGIPPPNIFLAVTYST